MSVTTAVSTKYLLDSLFQVRTHYEAQEFQAAIELIDRILASEELRRSGDAANARIHFLYEKAVALDSIQRPLEAFPIFEELVLTYPGTPEFEASIQVVCRNLANLGRQLVKEDPKHPLIKDLLAKIERHSVPPYWLIFPVAAQEIADGKVTEGYRRIRNVLALSPNDSDYLKCALSLAKAGRLDQEVAQLKQHISNLFEERPYRLDLVELMQEEMPAAPMAA